MSNSDFVIESGVLKKYIGAGGEVVIPEGVITIVEKAFAGNTDIISVTFPVTLEKIGSWAFLNCTKLKKLTFLGNVKLLDEACFMKCKNLRSVVAVKGLKRIEKRTFEECDKLKSVVISGATCKIGIGAFLWCSSLEELILPQKCKLKNMTFSEVGIIPEGLVSSLPKLHHNISGGDLADSIRTYNRRKKYAKYIDNELIAQIFLTDLSCDPIPRRIDRRAHYEFFRHLITSENAEEISKLIIDKLPSKATANEIISISCALVLLAKKAPTADLREIYNWIIAQNATEIAVKIIPCAELQYIAW